MVVLQPSKWLSFSNLRDGGLRRRGGDLARRLLPRGSGIVPKSVSGIYWMFGLQDQNLGVGGLVYAISNLTKEITHDVHTIHQQVPSGGVGSGFGGVRSGPDCRCQRCFGRLANAVQRLRRLDGEAPNQNQRLLDLTRRRRRAALCYAARR